MSPSENQFIAIFLIHKAVFSTRVFKCIHPQGNNPEQYMVCAVNAEVTASIVFLPSSVCNIMARTEADLETVE